jgi:hypothetical protein
MGNCQKGEKIETPTLFTFSLTFFMAGLKKQGPINPALQI